MTTYHLAPAFTSAMAGTEWERNFYTDAASIDALLADGDTVKIDAPEDNPWLVQLDFTNTAGLNVICNAGPSGKTCMTDGRTSQAWTGASAPFVLALAAKPTYVSNNYRRDTIDGAETGWNYSATELDDLFQWGIPQAWACAPLGWMLEDTSTPTTPAVGRWGWLGGNLYVNPLGSPSLADVKANVRYYPGSRYGILYSNCDYLNHRGMVDAWGLPHGIGQYGAAVRSDGMTGGTIADVWAADTGWHAVTIAGAGGGINNTIVKCRAIGGSGDSGAAISGPRLGEVNPFVIYQPVGESEYGGHRGGNLVHLMSPMFLDSGAPVSNNFAPRVVQTHSDSGTAFVGTSSPYAVEWDAIFGLEMSDRLQTRHSITISGRATLATHANGAIGDTTDPSTYPAKVTRGYLKGRGRIQFNGAVWYEECFHNGTGAGGVGDASHGGASGAFAIAYTDGWLIPGNHAEEFLDNMDANDMIVLLENKIFLVNAVNRSGLIGQALDVAATYNLRLRGNQIESNGLNTHCFVRASNATIYTNNLRSTLSLGGNVIGTAMEGTGGHSNPGVAPWDTDDTVTLWAARITGAGTDSRAALAFSEEVFRREFYATLGRVIEGRAMAPRRSSGVGAGVN